MTLPELVLYESYDSDYEKYIEALYTIFQTDFLYSQPVFKHDPSTIHINSRPYSKDKEFTFWHITTIGENEEERIIDLRRCERIRYPRFLIENHSTSEIKVWEKDVLAKKSREKRIHISNRDFSFLVVLSSLTKKDDVSKRALITAFYVEEKYQRKKYEKDFEKYKV